MSSLLVRSLVKQFIVENFPGEVLVDLTLESEELSQLLSNYDIQPGSPWLGVTFIGDEELPISLAATNDMGLYRETGAVELHVVEEAKIGVALKVLSRGEAFINAFRGQRIGPIVVESLSPVNTDSGATLEFEGGYVSGTVRIDYHCDKSPT